MFNEVIASIKSLQMAKDKLITTTTIPNFTLKDVNRYKISSKHVETLSKSMARTGRNLQPILVSSDGVVVDGQHRFMGYKAAKKINKDVTLYYIKSTYSWEDDKDQLLDTLSTLNTETETWRIKDWVNFYATTGNQHYVNLMNLWENDYPDLNLSAIAQITHAKYLGGNISNMIKKGHYEYTFTVDKKYLLDEISSLRQEEAYFAHRGFMSAVLAMATDPTFDAKRLFRKIRATLGNLDPQSGQGAWEGYLCKLYNKSYRGKRLVPRAKAY